jgi:hypothetical protein
MFSPQMFERFFLPELSACCSALDHPFYHLDGPGALPHLPALLSLPELCGIQWVPTDRKPGAREWLPLLQQINASGKLCQLYVSAEEALEIVRLTGGKGFALYVNNRMSAGEAEAFLRKINQEIRIH